MTFNEIPTDTKSIEWIILVDNDFSFYTNSHIFFLWDPIENILIATVNEENKYIMHRRPSIINSYL